MEKRETVKTEVIEGGVKKVINIIPEYVGRDGRAHVSHVNAINARNRDKNKKEEKKKEGGN